MEERAKGEIHEMLLDACMFIGFGRIMLSAVK